MAAKAPGLKVKYAANAGSAGTAGAATSATTAAPATTAGNANALGGIPASGFTQSNCNSLTGAVKGFAVIPGSSGFSGSFVKIAGAYNCSGAEVEAEREGPGIYVVKFVDSPTTIAIAQVTGGDLLGNSTLVENRAGGEFQVDIYNSYTKESEDVPFSVVTP